MEDSLANVNWPQAFTYVGCAFAFAFMLTGGFSNKD